MKYPKLVETQTVIRFQDCDPFNHLNNGRYIDYFMNHREDVLIQHYNIDIYKMAKELGKSWVSGSNQLAYLRPAFTMETITIQSQVIKFNESNIWVEMRMYNEDKTQLKAVMWAQVVHFDLLKQRRAQHDEQYMNLFQSILNPLEQTTFEERIRFVKSTMYQSV
jgi:acyl-CoA thioester hydrolase